MSDRAIETPRHELAAKAQAHYSEVSSAAMYSMSLIPEAITAWEKLPALIDAANARAERLAALLAKARRWMEPFVPFAGTDEWSEREPLKAEIDAALAAPPAAGTDA